jgi:hypothetical protein
MMNTIPEKNRSFILENENREISAKTKQIFEDSVCSVYAFNNHFEVWAKLRGKIIIPNDESFGLWAWSAYTRERAEQIAAELRNGKRKVEITWKEAEE